MFGTKFQLFSLIYLYASFYTEIESGSGMHAESGLESDVVGKSLLLMVNVYIYIYICMYVCMYFLKKFCCTTFIFNSMLY